VAKRQSGKDAQSQRTIQGAGIELNERQGLPPLRTLTKAPYSSWGMPHAPAARGGGKRADASSNRLRRASLRVRSYGATAREERVGRLAYALAL
jgi:hypothetical protein